MVWFFAFAFFGQSITAKELQGIRFLSRKRSPNERTYLIQYKKGTNDHRILETWAMKRHHPRAPAGRCGKGFGQQPWLSFYAVSVPYTPSLPPEWVRKARIVRAMGTLRLVTIGWDMAVKAEDSLAPSALPQSTNHSTCRAFPQPQLAVERPIEFYQYAHLSLPDLA